MSMAVKRANMVVRTSYRGDSFIGDLGKGLVKGALGFVTGGPAGAVAGVASAFIPQPKATVQQQIPGAPPALPGGGVTIGLPQIQWPGGGIGGGGISMGGPFAPAAPAGTSLVQTSQGLMCVANRGTHVNKTSYYTRQGFVPAGSKCVSNRRMNPLNPRALSRAMRRITSAKGAASVLGRITIRKASCKGCK